MDCELGLFGRLNLPKVLVVVHTFTSLFLVFQQIGVAFLLIILLIVLAIGVIQYWASNNFYLTRAQMFFVCSLAFLLALAAFLLGWFEGIYPDFY